MSSKTVVWYIQPYSGGPGVGRYHRGYALAREWLKVGIETHIFCGSNHHLLDAAQAPDSYKYIDGCHYHFLGLPSYSGNGILRLVNMLSFGRVLSRYVANLKFKSPSNIIYSSPHPFGAVAALRIARSHDSGFILEVRDLWPESLLALSGMSSRHPLVLYLSRLERKLYRSVDQVVSLLPCTTDYMKSRGLCPARWNYIPNGISSCPSPKDVVHHNSELYLWLLEKQRSGKRVLVYAGSVGLPNKVHRLIEAVELLPESKKAEIEILIIGRGTEMSKLKTSDESISLRLESQVDRDILMQLLELCHGGFISLAPSDIFRHGISPNKMFDYMKVGLPVISAINAGNDPVAEAGCGWSVSSESASDLSQAILNWINCDIPTLARMGLDGQMWVAENHGYSMLAREYLRVFSQASKNSRSFASIM